MNMVHRLTGGGDFLVVLYDEGFLTCPDARMREWGLGHESE